MTGCRAAKLETKDVVGMGVKHRMISESKSACGRLVTQGDGRPCKNCERVVYAESARAEAHTAKVNAATVTDAPTVEEIESACAVTKQNGRVFVAEAHHFARPEAFAQAVTDGLLTLVDDDDMSRYVPTRRTADGVIITQGLPVWDNNLDPGTVDLTSISSDGWFHVHTVKSGRSLMNAERIATRHPFSRALASDVLAAMAQPTEPIPANSELFSDRDMGVQILAYLGTDVDGFYVDGIIDDIIARKGGAVNVDTIDPDEFTAIVQTYATTHASEAMLNAAIAAGEAYARVGDDYLNVSDDSAEIALLPDCCNECDWDAVESAVWAGTGTLIKPAIRTLLGRRKRKATKKARRAVRGGF